MKRYNAYPYDPDQILPAVFAAIIGASLGMHISQNFRYRFWRIAFFLVWGGAVFMSGWILRALSARDLTNLNLYIAQTVLVLAGPPIYAAVEYNILARLMHYLPMHAPLHPSRVVYLFIYIGVAVEALTAVGVRRISENEPGSSRYVNGGKFISVSLVLQGVVECFFIGLVAQLHIRCKRADMLAPNVRSIFIMLYGTSTLILLRCIFRAVEAFSKYNNSCKSYNCGAVDHHEWYLYVFEAAPMVIYTYWLNVIHPGRFLPSTHKRYLDPDGKTERIGPGWIDRRPAWITFVDLFDVAGAIQGRPDDTQFWLRPDEWALCKNSFALGRGSNRRRRAEDEKASV